MSGGRSSATQGRTGYSTACHLHFMVYDDGVRRQPDEGYRLNTRRSRKGQP